MKIDNVLALGLCLPVLAGCGVTLDAVRVVGMDPEHPTPSLISGSGIVYALPKTDFEVVQPIKLRVATGGPAERDVR